MKTKNILLIAGVFIIVGLLFYFGVMQQQFITTNLSNYSTLEAQQNIPFTANLIVGDVENFVISPFYSADSRDTIIRNNLIWNTKYEIFNFKTTFWEDIEIKNINLKEDGHSYLTLTTYGLGLYNSPNKYIQEGNIKIANKQTIQTYSCFKDAILPEKTISEKGTVRMPKCYYPGDLVDCTDYDQEKTKYKEYCYFPNYYTFTSDYLKNGIADIRITYSGNLKDSAAFDAHYRYFRIAIIDKTEKSIIEPPIVTPSSLNILINLKTWLKLIWESFSSIFSK